MRATWTAALIGLLLACGGGPAPTSVSDDEARRYVLAVCTVLPTASECSACAIETLVELTRQRVITSVQHEALRRDATTACDAPSCAPTTTCAASKRGCGQIPDGCGASLTCGAACSSRAWCLLRNATKAAQPLDDYAATQVDAGYAANAVSDDGIPACAEEGPAVAAAIALLRERCAAIGPDLLGLYCSANSAAAVSADAVLDWGPGCWADLTKVDLDQGPQLCVSP